MARAKGKDRPKVVVVKSAGDDYALRILDEDGAVVKPGVGGVRGPGGRFIRPTAASRAAMQAVLASLYAHGGDHEEDERAAAS